MKLFGYLDDLINWHINLFNIHPIFTLLLLIAEMLGLILFMFFIIKLLPPTE